MDACELLFSNDGHANFNKPSLILKGKFEKEVRSQHSPQVLPRQVRNEFVHVFFVSILAGDMTD